MNIGVDRMSRVGRAGCSAPHVGIELNDHVYPSGDGTFGSVKRSKLLLSDVQGACEMPIRVKPYLTYEDALMKQFSWQDQIYQVEQAPAPIFRAFIEHCGRQKKLSNVWTKVLLDELLEQIDEQCDGLTRWYCLDVLLQHRVSVVLSDVPKLDPKSGRGA